jgi:hypothetical protein
MDTLKVIFGWVIAILFLLFVFAMDDSYHVRRGETKPWPWEQFTK